MNCDCSLFFYYLGILKIATNYSAVLGVFNRRSYVEPGSFFLTRFLLIDLISLLDIGDFRFSTYL